MADKLTIKWDEEGLKRAIGHSGEIQSKITEMTDQRIQKANSLSSGFKTGRYYDRDEGKLKGETPAKYGGGVEKMGRYQWPYGLIHPLNYAAMKDNYVNNTLLKVK